MLANTQQLILFEVQLHRFYTKFCVFWSIITPGKRTTWWLLQVLGYSEILISEIMKSTRRFHFQSSMKSKFLENDDRFLTFKSTSPIVFQSCWIEMLIFTLFIMLNLGEEVLYFCFFLHQKFCVEISLFILLQEGEGRLIEREKDWWFRTKLSKLGKFNSLEMLELQVYNDIDCLVKLHRSKVIVLFYIAH